MSSLATDLDLGFSLGYLSCATSYNFAFHFNERMKKAKAAKAWIKKLNKTYKFFPGLV